jgi:hypothetical protein
MYRWVDADGVVNYSNIPPPAQAKAKRIAESEPTVSVIPPRERGPETQAARDAREAALIRRIEQLEDDLAQLRRGAIQSPAYVSYPAPPAIGYADYGYGASFVYPVPVYPWAIRPAKPHPPRFRPGHPAVAPHGAPRGLTVRMGR